MEYFFVLGTNPALSAAEIAAVLPENKNARLLAGEILILENKEIDCAALIKKLGGTIKIGLVFGASGRRREELESKISKIIENDIENNDAGGKYCFGFSYYGRGHLDTMPIGLEIKKSLKEKGKSSRLVVSRERILSSVVVEQNKLTRGGAEIVLAEDGQKILIGRTAAVQDFKNLSYRDFGRPQRDDASGMLPPKLAQIMLNLSGKDFSKASVLDPFCGSGTILMEAALMGAKEATGSDISAKAIADTKTNIDWVGKNLRASIPGLKLFNVGAERISGKIPPKAIDAIVTEPYLGPQRGSFDPVSNKINLEKLYSAALAEFKRIIKPDGRVVMVFPVRTEGPRPEFHFLNPKLDGWQVTNPLPKELQSGLHATRRGTIVYGRQGQKVWREIVVLKPL